MESEPAPKSFSFFDFLDQEKTKPTHQFQDASLTPIAPLSDIDKQSIQDESLNLQITPHKIESPPIIPEQTQPILFPVRKIDLSRKKKLFEKKTDIPAEYAQTRISDFFNQKKTIQNPQEKPYLKVSELNQNSELKKYEGFFHAPVPQDMSPALKKKKKPKSKPFTFAKNQIVQKEKKAPKRVRKMVSKPKLNSIDKISNNEIKRLAKRGGVERVGVGIYSEIRTKLRGFLERLVQGAMDMTEQRGRKTVTALDVVQTLKIQGALKMRE